MPGMLAVVSRALMHCYPFANGQGRVIDRSFMGRLKFAETTMRVRCAGGFSMDVLPNDHIGRHLYLTGQFDGAIVAALKSFCPRGDERILDIGANVGSVSCALLHALPGCRVAAVEPLPEVYKLLSRNLAEVGGGRGVAVNVAVAEHDGVGTMTVPGGETGSSHLVDGDPSDSAQPRVEVRVVGGPRLLELAGLDRIDLIKIDVEGFELTVLRALAGMIREQRPRAVLFEHFGDLPPGAPIRQLLEECGYRLHGLVKSLRRFSLVPSDELMARGIPTHDHVAIRE